MNLGEKDAVEYIIQEVMDANVGDLNSKEIQVELKELLKRLRSEVDIKVQEQQLDDIIARVKDVLISFSSCHGCNKWSALFTDDYTGSRISSYPKFSKGCRHYCSTRTTIFNDYESGNSVQPKPLLTISDKVDFIERLSRIEFDI